MPGDIHVTGWYAQLGRRLAAAPVIRALDGPVTATNTAYCPLVTGYLPIRNSGRVRVCWGSSSS